jgi:hypothetical protein
MNHGLIAGEGEDFYVLRHLQCPIEISGGSCSGGKMTRL